MAPQPTKLTLTAEEVRMLVDTHELDSLMNNDEEAEMLKEHNPDLYDIYHKMVFTPFKYRD